MSLYGGPRQEQGRCYRGTAQEYQLHRFYRGASQRGAVGRVFRNEELPYFNADYDGDILIDRYIMGLGTFNDIHEFEDIPELIVETSEDMPELEEI